MVLVERFQVMPERIDGIFEDDTRHVAFTLPFRLCTVLARRSFLSTLDPSSSTRQTPRLGSLACLESHGRPLCVRGIRVTPGFGQPHLPMAVRRGVTGLVGTLHQYSMPVRLVTVRLHLILALETWILVVQFSFIN